MIRIVTIIILLLTFSSTTYANVIDNTGKELEPLKTTDGYLYTTDTIKANIENLKQHTVILTRIETDGQYGGAGIAIDKRHILTANHVAELNSKIFYSESKDSEPIWATVIKTDPTHDLSLLEIDKGATDLKDGMTFAKDITLDETVYTIGHPKGHMYSLTQGEVTDFHQKGFDKIDSVELKIKIKSGNSGGMVINSQGEIVGMIFSGQDMVGNMAYMIGKDDIQNFLK